METVDITELVEDVLAEGKVTLGELLDKLGKR